MVWRGKQIEKDVSGGVLGECKGVIERRGNKYGFIKSETHGNVFVFADELKGYKEGHIVKFTAFLDDTGGVQAKDLKSGLKDGNAKVTSRQGFGAARATSKKGFSKQRSFGKAGERKWQLWGKGGKGRLGIRRSTKPKDTSAGVIGESKGTITNRANKYGFIDDEEHGQVFVFADELKRYQTGQTVKYTVFIDDTGGFQAKDLKSGLKPDGAKSARKGGGKGFRSSGKGWKHHSGARKEKDTSGGILGESSGTITNRGPKYGFIEDAQHGTVFVFADELKMYQAGQKVKYTVFVDDTGGHQAKDLKSGLK